MRVRIPPGTLDVIFKEVKVRLASIWGADLITNIRSVLYYSIYITKPHTDFFGILSDLAESFSEIEKYNHKVNKVSAIEYWDRIEIIVINSEFLGYKMTILFGKCENCRRKLLLNNSNIKFHELNCPYRIVVDIMES